MQDGERELRAVHFLVDLDVDLLERPCIRGPLCDLLVAIEQLRAQLLHGALDASRNLAGLFVTDRLGELRTRMGQRAERIPARDDVLGRDRDGVEGVPKGRSRRFEILGQHDFFFALKRSSATDFLEIGFERSPFTTGVEFLSGNDRSRAHARVAVLV